MRKFLLFIFFLICKTGFSQTGGPVLFTEKDGLSNPQVNCMLSDAKGFIWVGTENGLNRFDGLVFDIFRHEDANPASISGNQIQTLITDADGRLWAGTDEGISMYDPGSQTFSNYAPDTLLLSNIGTTFQAICVNGRSGLWVGTKNDLLYFDFTTKKFSSTGWAAFAAKVVPAGANHLRVIVLDVFPKSESEVWVITTYGLFSMNTRQSGFRYYPYANILDYNGCRIPYANTKGDVLISLYGGGFLHYNENRDDWKLILPDRLQAGFNVKTVFQPQDDSILTGFTGNLFFRYNLHTDQTEKISVLDLPVPHTCNGTALLRHGQTSWAGSNQGLIRLPEKKARIRFFPLSVNDTVTGIFFTRKGDLLFQLNTRSVFVKTKNGIFPLQLQGRKYDPVPYFYAAESAEGKVYFNDESGVYEWDQNTMVARSLPMPPLRNPEHDQEIRNMVVDREGIVWIRSTTQGILRYDPAKQEMHYVPDLPDGKKFEINRLYYDNATHQLCISEEFRGVYHYVIATGHITHDLLNEPPSQRGAAMTAISGDQAGIIWMAGSHSGIYRYSAKTGIYKRFGNPLPSITDVYNSLLTDYTGHCWANTAQGLLQIDSFGAVSGWFPVSADFAPNAGFITAGPDHHFALPQKNGYISWATDSLFLRSGADRLYWREIRLDDTRLPVKNDYHFSYRENNIRFLAGVLSFEEDAMPQAEYQLNKNGWKSFDLHLPLAFYNLAPGQYQLRIRLVRSPDRDMQVDFEVEAPFWNQIWFRLLLGLAVALLLYFIWIKRMAAVQKRAAALEEKTRSEITALRSQMNPHFVFNTLNSINSYIIEHKNEEAAGYLTEFSKLMRLTLEHSQREYIPLEEELHAVKLYLELECKRLGEQFDYTIRQHTHNALLVPSMIIQPFVENAIWHGLRTRPGEKHILIEIEEQGAQIRVTVEDNGIGRRAAAQAKSGSSSFGMKATEKRLQLYDPDSTITVEDLQTNGEASGTRVILIFKKVKHEQAD